GTSGQAGNINVKTGSLFVRNGGQLTSSTSGKGNAGNITINATGIVSFEGKDSEGIFSGIFSTVNETGVGNGGEINITAGSLLINEGFLSNNVTRGAKGNAANININTGSLFITNGGQLSSSTSGEGNAGNITINATGTVSLDGIDNQGKPSAVFSTVEAGGVGNGGEINITARSLSLTNGGELNTFIRRGGNGTAGNVKLNISDQIKITGTDSGIFSNVLSGATGNGGNIEILKGSLFIADGGEINASTSGNGNAGGIKINANSLFVDGGQLITNSEVENRQAGNIEITTAKDIRLDNGAFISANTNGGQGNITLNSRDLILRRNSNITTNAIGTATGGNITIKTGNLVAFPKEDSNISANADRGPGGRVSIGATRIFGIEFRKQPTQESDITATSNLGPDFSGNVQINTPDVDPSQGLLELPDNLADASSQIAQNPCQKGFGSSFTVTGRGGLPSSPNDSLSSDNVRVGLVNPSTSTSSSQSSTINQPITQSTGKQIIPAQGWIFNDKGEVVLTAYDPTTTNPQRTSQPTAACPAF
ncbi:MAG: filamentous hemagglutinin, partial [Hapalosiphonaceae cyanobacterium JJU2]